MESGWMEWVMKCLDGTCGQNKMGEGWRDGGRERKEEDDGARQRMIIVAPGTKTVGASGEVGGN